VTDTGIRFEFRWEERRSLRARHWFPRLMARALRIERPRGHLVGGLDYAVVSKAMARSDRRLCSDAPCREQLAAIQRQLSK